MKKKNTEH